MATERRLFGTDGVRGEAGTFLTAELATALGRAVVSSLEAERPQVLIVRDTRESGPMIESALAAGIAAAGGDALLGGVLPTPAAAILVKRLGLDLAAVVSASHNPYRDNGIKFFSAAGTKLDDAAEARIEARSTARGRLGGAGAGARAERRPRGLPAGAARKPSRSTSPASPSPSTAPTAPPTVPGRRSSSASAPWSRRSASSPTGATSTTAAARPISTRLARRCHPGRPRSASPSTATATACSPSTAPAAPTTATS